MTQTNNRYLKIFLLLFITQVGIYSCNSRFEVNDEYIKKTGGPFPGFNVHHITVIEQDESGLPKEYTENNTVWLILGLNKEGSNKIFFKKPNKDYQWTYSDSPDFFDTFPIKFEANNWYRIGGLEKSGSQDYEIFIHVLENGDFEIFDKHTPRI